MRSAIALYGKSGAGKTTVAEYLAKRYGFLRCSTGDACRQVCRMLFNSESKTLLNKVTDALKAVDEEVWLRAATAADNGTTPIVFDSMRFACDYHFLTARGFSRWKVVAPLEVRIPRLRAREQEFDPAVDENHPAEIELETYHFDAILDNGKDDLAALHRTVDQILRG